MKKFVRFFSFLIVALLCLPSLVFAQQVPPMGIDPDVRVGKLSNGLTYYIRHNEYPKGQAEFYIAQKVGSILEEDNQRGLAHFLEHMCFNGTTHFPGNSLVEYLETIGVKFGAHLNAYTATDQTVYNSSSVPTAREGSQDSCLLILHDWANDLLLEPAEIDAERAVIHEEWRRSTDAQMRILETLLPKIYPNSRYGLRLPIGTMEVVDNFPYQALRDYYEKWYRPDQQAVIVVGDIDVDRIEGKIKEMFSSIEMPENAAERIYLPVEDTEGTIYAIGHDKEQRSAVAQLMFKTDPLPIEMRGTMMFYLYDYIKTLATQMLNERLQDISSKPDAPFAMAGANYGNFFVAKTKEALTLLALPKNANDVPQELAAAYRELLRAARGGFTITEYERAKAEYLSQAEKAYENRNKRQNNVFVQAYVNNFLDNNPMPSAEEAYNTRKQITQMVNVNMINQFMQQMVTPNNRVLLCLLPDNADGVYPTEKEFEAALSAVDGETIEPYKEVLKSEPLIEKLPAAGKIVSEKKLSQWDATEWTLSNGVKVIIKPTTFKDNEILFTATAINGTSVVPVEKASSLIFMHEILNQYGLGSYTKSDLDKYLAGKQAKAALGLSQFNRYVSGTSTPKDLQTLMELIYMTFTNANYSADEFQALQNTYISALQNQAANPQYVFQTKLYESLYPNNPRQRALTIDIVKAASRDDINAIAHQMTDNAAEFTFNFVGNIDESVLRPLVEQYIATLPANAKKARTKIADLKKAEFSQVKGENYDSFTTEMETPQTLCYISEFGAIKPYNTKNAMLANIAGQILSSRLVEIVREKEGAVYSISASGDMDRIDVLNTEIVTSFPMKPEMKDKVLTIIREQLNNLENDIKKEELDKIKEYMLKSYKQAFELNSAWLKAINGWAMNGVDTFNDGIETINAITIDDVKAFMKQLNKQKNYHVIIVDPEK